MPVMLTSNLNVEDGLINGVIGTVKSILSNESSTLPSAIADIAKVGTSTKRPQPKYSDCILIKPSVETFTFKTMSIQRYQFPLKLPWAVTINKVHLQLWKKHIGDSLLIRNQTC